MNGYFTTENQLLVTTSNFAGNSISLNPAYTRQLYIDLPSSNGDRKLTNNFGYWKRLFRGMHGTYSAVNTQSGGYFHQVGEFNTGFGSLDEPDEFTDWLQEDALTRFYEKLRGSIDLSIDTFQANQTYKMVKTFLEVVAYVRSFPKKALQKSADAFHQGIRDGSIRPDGFVTKNQRYRKYRVQRRIEARKGRKRRTVWETMTGYTKHAGSLWLGYTYGLKPTVTTLYDTIVELGRNIEPLMKVKATAKRKETFDITEPGSGYYGGTFPKRGVGGIQETCTFAAQFKSSANISDLLGRFTSLNPVSIFWELLPGSFVADWLINVGGYLRNLESYVLAKSLFLSGWALKRKKKHVAVEMKGTSYIDQFNPRIADQTGWYQFTRYQRVRLTSAPSPSTPRFRLDLSSGRLLNAAALLTVFLRR